MELTSEERIIARRNYHNMMRRCYDDRPQNYKSYKSYGGKGVTVCERWKESVNNYIEDLPKIENFDKEKYLKGEIHLDKDFKQQDIENKIYSVETCIFLTREENNELQDNKKEFYVVCPDGQIIHGFGIKTFCKNKDLEPNHAMEMVRGLKIRKHVGGYQFFDHYPNEDEILKRRTYLAVSPNGERFEFYYMNSLKKLYGFSRGKISNSIKSGKPTKDGWQFFLLHDGYKLMEKGDK